jgi:hypothetical protein
MNTADNVAILSISKSQLQSVALTIGRLPRDDLIFV